MTVTEVALNYLKNGYSVLPLSDDKKPVGKWTDLQKKAMSEGRAKKEFASVSAIGLVCGTISGGVEVIDVDCKYDLLESLYLRYTKMIEEMSPGIMKKMKVQKTVNKGYHLIYKTDNPEGNKKLASRYATEEEKKKGNKIFNLIETRGEGGYICVVPTKGYEFIDKSGIQKITGEEREVLITAAKSFNEVVKEFIPPVKKMPKTGSKSCFEDYNERGDTLELLQKHGWTIKRDDGDKVFLKRPGTSDSNWSADYTRSLNWFTVFSSSTEFETEKAYNPSAVFTILECGGDFSLASKKLYSEGYGERFEKRFFKEKKYDLSSDTYEFVASDKDMDEYIEQVREGKLEMGLSTGFDGLDKNFRFKKGNLVAVNGHDNVGKSVFMWFMATITAVLYDWKWIIFSAENKTGGVKRKLIEFYCAKPMGKIESEEYKKAKRFIEDHFTILRNDDSFSADDLIKMGERLFERKNYEGFLMDPYNSLEIELSSYSKLSTHDYHYAVLGKFRVFCTQYNCCVYLNCHAVTEALRRKDSDGYPMAPHKADTEGGGKFANRVDDFITVHRKTQHPEDWMITEVHIRKIKESETGGRPTALDNPVKLRMSPGLCGFIDENGYNPVSGSVREEKKEVLIDYTEPLKDQINETDEVPF